MGATVDSLAISATAHAESQSAELEVASSIAQIVAKVDEFFKG